MFATLRKHCTFFFPFSQNEFWWNFLIDDKQNASHAIKCILLDCGRDKIEVPRVLLSDIKTSVSHENHNGYAYAEEFEEEIILFIYLYKCLLFCLTLMLKI